MQEKVQRLVHTFAALADLGQEIADPHFPAQWDPKLGIHVT